MKIKIEDIFNVLKKELDIFTFNELTNCWKLDKIKQEGFIKNMPYNDYPFTYILDCWKQFYPKIDVKSLEDKIYEYECNFRANEIYEKWTRDDWRINQIKKLADLEDQASNDKTNKKLSTEEILHIFKPTTEWNWLLPTYYSQNIPGFIPIHWLKNFEIIKANTKGSKEQGENNGPDFIFKDKTKNWLIGVEIILLHPNILIYDLNKIKNPSEYTKKFEKTNSKPIFDELNRLVTSHTNSLKKYEKCNKYYLIIQTNNFLPEFMYQLLECYANDFLNKENKWEHIYIF